MSETDAKNKIFAVIDIGSYSIKMKLAEAAPDGTIRTLETPRKFVNLGKDTFLSGMIRNENAEEICSTLKGFKRLISEYRTDEYAVVATSALREANNCDYILDFVYQRTGLKIDIISESEERFYTYCAIINSLPEFPVLKKEGLLIADISAGGVEITLFGKGELLFTQYIKMGSLRLKELLSDLERRTLDFPTLIGEFIESELDTVKVVLTQNRPRDFMVIGSEIRVVHDMLAKGKKGGNRSYLDKEAFYSVYHQLIGKSRQQILDRYALDPERVLTLVPALLMYEKFLSFTHAEKIYTPAVSLSDGLIRSMADSRYAMENRSLSLKDIVASVKKLGERYSYDEKHAEQVERIAMLLFDSMKKQHGYSERERLILQIAAIAHDFGKFINVKKHNVLSHDIILNSEILGVPGRDRLIAANIARYHSSAPGNSAVLSDTNYHRLDYDARIMVSKLAAFLRIADALDRSHKQKLSDIRIVAGDQALSIRAETTRDALLEEWEFENKSALFQEVYGMKPQLTIKRK